ncbi:Transcription initiation factor IIF subunit alpha [Glycine soja]
MQQKMSTDLQLKSSCSGCGSTTDLYGSNCKHMTLCLGCGKTMAAKRAKCVDCGATLTRLIRVRNTGGGRSHKKTDEDDEGHVSDKGEEDEEEESERKSRLGLNKRAGEDDEEGPRGGDHDLDDDDVEKGEYLAFFVHYVSDENGGKGDDWEHEEIFTDDDEAVGNDPEEREDLAPEVPAPPEIKQDEEEEDEDNEEGEGLSKSGKELKKLLGKASGLNESDAEDDDDDDDDVDDDVGVPPVIATKQKDALKEEPIDNSPSKPTATGPARGTPSSKSSKGKRKLNEETKPSNTATPKKEPKLSAKDVNGSASKSSAPPKGTPPLSSKGGSSTTTTASGPVSEEEIRAVLRQKTPVTTQDLVAKFKARLRCSEDKQAFAEILKRISKIQKTTTGASYVILRDK